MTSDRAVGVSTVLATARASFEAMSGRKVDSVSAVGSENGSWRLGFEVVELERVPDSTSLMGSYDVLAGDDGNVVEFTRIRRYYRNRADEEP